MDMIGERLSRFTLISGGGWLLDVGVMLGLVAAGTSPFVANLIGALCGVSSVFVLAQRRVFTTLGGGGVRWRLFLPYLCWQAVAIPAASALVALIANVAAGAAEIPAAWFAVVSPVTISAAVIAAGVAKVAVTPLTLYANFVFSGWLMERRVAWR
jgi:putative flippase GtrA